MNKELELALKTWYPVDHPLHYDIHHPLGKLIGEWGELLDDYMKSVYKPGYVLTPEDELGDIWYYVRVLAYLTGSSLVDRAHFDDSTDRIIARCLNDLVRWFLGLASGKYYPVYLNRCYSATIEIARRYNLTIDDLTKSNWQKLKPSRIVTGKPPN